MSFSIEVITLMPELWPPLLSEAAGLSGRAVADGTVQVRIANLRDFGTGRHQQVDDTPFGGGAGMVLQVPPLHQAIERARARTPGPVLLLSPRGAPFHQARALELAEGTGFTLVCGRYEGFDERVRRYVDDELSVGDFVLTGGDPAAWCVIDACIRLRPGILGNAASAEDESFTRGGLEYPHYTRPASYDGAGVPDVLRSGDHGRIAEWREEQARSLTRALRPDLLDE
ncbi:MAG: tRNA (guanosine(37)-N1)-methyltransferase TrmD [Myxococcota bacterium]